MQRPRSPIRIESVTQTLNQVEVLVLKRKGLMWQKTAATHSETVRATRATTVSCPTLVRMNDPHYISHLRGIGRMMMVSLNRRRCWAKWWLQFKIVRLKNVRIVFCTVSIQYYWSELMLITERGKWLWALMYSTFICVLVEPKPAPVSKSAHRNGNCQKLWLQYAMEDKTRRSPKAAHLFRLAAMF